MTQGKALSRDVSVIAAFGSALGAPRARPEPRDCDPLSLNQGLELRAWRNGADRELVSRRHVRGKWACAKCRTLTQATVPAEIIDKGLPTSSLLAHVLVAKHSGHLPL